MTARRDAALDYNTAMYFRSEITPRMITTTRAICLARRPVVVRKAEADAAPQSAATSGTR
jgi:hypothetical protein